MSAVKTFFLERTDIAIRLLYTIFFLIVFEILKLIIQVSVLFQYVLLLITRSHNEPLQRFCNKVLSYAYRVMRYVTLNENQRPFPFTDFPPEIEPAEAEIRFK
ncbi:MAG: DUF4389 domain-containing protein [Desulfosarcinaceae bacterium]